MLMSPTTGQVPQVYCPVVEAPSIIQFPAVPVEDLLDQVQVIEAFCFVQSPAVTVEHFLGHRYEYELID